MQRLISNQACKLYHTQYCDLLNMPTCEDCFVNKRADAEQVMADLDVLSALMPEGGITHLFTSEECQFCKGQKGKRAWYAMLDMGHAEPARTERSVIGIKTKSKIGSMLPVQIAACNGCKTRMRRVDTLPMLIPIVFAAVALILLLIGPLNDAMARIHAIVPLGLFVVMTGLGILVGQLVKRQLTKSYAQVTRINPFEIPTIFAMQQKGWFVISSNNPDKPPVEKRKEQQG